MCVKNVEKIDIKHNFVDQKFNFDNNYHRNTYIYLNENNYGIVWKNVVLFILLHLFAIAGIFLCLTTNCPKTWLFSYFYGFFSGIGVTGGAHRLWSHRSYKAKLPLRLLLAFLFTISGQNDLFTWCRDHRVHHKFSETDADPHNSKRGFFFAHMGWLMTRKHPEVYKKGKEIDLSDLRNDPVVRYNKLFYVPLYLLISLYIPIAIPVYFWNEKWLNSLCIAFALRYTTTLHCTWLVNSAAHMFGQRPYNKNIEPRENVYVAYAAFGEGFHNYHHTFPWDYATSELGYKLNLTKIFIDFMAFIGQAYDLKYLTPKMIELRKKQV